jgi:hypothetical protein
MALLCAAASFPAAAQGVPRIKATVVAFDGAVITVKPEGEKDTMKIGVRPATQIMKQDEKALADIPAGAFVGATLTRTAQGGYRAQEVHVFPENLRGSGEGLYPASPGSDHFILDGAVTAVSSNSLSVKFRGASGEGAACTGRAPADPLKGCQGNASVTVEAGTPVMALSQADKALITPGAVLAMSIMAGPDGKPVTPGLTIQTLATPPVPLPADAAKPAATAKQFSQRPKKP